MRKRELPKLSTWDIIGFCWRDAYTEDGAGKTADLVTKPRRPCYRREVGFFLGFSADGKDLLYTYVDDRLSLCDEDYVHLNQTPIAMIQSLLLLRKDPAE